MDFSRCSSMAQNVRAQGRGPDITTLCSCNGTEVKHKARNRMLPRCSGTSPNKESESYQTAYVTTQKYSSLPNEILPQQWQKQVILGI